LTESVVNFIRGHSLIYAVVN